MLEGRYGSQAGDSGVDQRIVGLEDRQSMLRKKLILIHRCEGSSRRQHERAGGFERARLPRGPGIGRVKLFGVFRSWRSISGCL